MNKSIVLLLIAILGCTYALHMQKYAPSRPGGTTYQGTTNGTSPSTRPSSGSSSGNATPMINGQPYVYTGPFTLSCWLPNNTKYPFRSDTCWDR